MAAQKKKKKQKKHTKLGFALKMIFLVVLITILLVGILFYLKYGKTLLGWRDEAVTLVRQSTMETFRQSETSEVYDTNGKLITTLKGAKDTYYIDYTDIPKDAVDAMVAIEDKRFWKHNGVDLKGIIRAAKSYIDNKGEITQGASTITQQLSRGIFLTYEVSMERKIKEMFIAFELEKKFSKENIMEFYLNNIYFANGYYGIQAASKGYFSKDVGELSLAEITFLCAIPNSPNLYDPIDHIENTVKRQGRILKQMKEEGYISQREYSEALSEKIKLNVTKIKRQDYVETYVLSCAVKALMESQGFVFRYSFASEEEKETYMSRYDEVYAMCQQSLYSSGYKIYTSIDMSKQKKLQKSVNEILKGFTSKNEEGIYELQGASTCIDNETGRVVAIVGGRSQKTIGYTLNRAFQSYRQPGSSIKPLIVYTPVFERGYTPASMVNDVKAEDGPRNSNNSYAGKITMRQAIEQSKNTVAWSLFEELTPAVGLQYLLNMNFSKISDNDYYPAASLGGFTNGVSTVEMASGFATIENDGIFREPTCIVKIEDAHGNEIVSDLLSTKSIYESNAARMMISTMEGVFTNGTGRGLGLSGMSCAGKTGTTDDKKDGWFVGFTPYYTTSVWVGYDLPKTLNDLYGSTYPGKIWNLYMSQIHEGLTDSGFSDYTQSGGSKNEADMDSPSPSPTPEEDIEDEDNIMGEEETKPDDTVITPDDGEEEPTYPGEEDSGDMDGSFDGDDDVPEETPQPPVEEPSAPPDEEPSEPSAEPEVPSEEPEL